MKTLYNAVCLIILVALGIIACAVPASAEVSVSFLYKLSNFVGAIPYSTPKIVADKVKGEVYVLSGSAVSIFNNSGMEIFRSEFDPEVGTVYDLAVDSNGDIFTLNFKDRKMSILLCNYRLDPQRSIALSDLPAEFAGFSPNQMRYRDGLLYLGNTNAMTVVIVDREGRFVKGYDLVSMLGEQLDDKEKSKGKQRTNEQRRADNGLASFNLDEAGNVLFVLPVLGRAGMLTADGKAVLFGKRGNGHGKFGVPGGITSDGKGHYLVSDKLRNLVIVFNKNFEYVHEFDSAGVIGSDLASPSVMDVDSSGKLYISQAGNRGVNVYLLDDNS